MKKRNIFLGIVCFLMIFMLTGCKDKIALSAEEFKSKVESNGYTAHDVTDQYSEYEYIKTGIVALSSSNYQIEFYVLDNESNAQRMFDDNKSKFESSQGSVSSHSEASLKNYSTYTLNSNGKYMHLCRVDNTLLYVDVDETYKDQVKDLVNKLGY